MTQHSLSDVAVVLAAHGDRGGSSPNATLLTHAKALEKTGRFRCVTAGALRADDLQLDAALIAARASGAAAIAVYPFFMADGYFTRKVLPERIAATGLGGLCVQLPPLGLDPGIPHLMMRHALTEAAAAALAAEQTRLLVVGHGSKSGRASLRSTERAACKLRQVQAFCAVETAYLEEEPHLVARLSSSPLPTLVLGFFSGDGLHAAEDVPEAITRSGADARYAGPAGRLSGVQEIIASAVAMAFGAPGSHLNAS